MYGFEEKRKKDTVHTYTLYIFCVRTFFRFLSHIQLIFTSTTTRKRSTFKADTALEKKKEDGSGRKVRKKVNMEGSEICPTEKKKRAQRNRGMKMRGRWIQENTKLGLLFVPPSSSCERV